MTAALALYGEFTRITFLKMLAYRLRYYTGVISYLIFVAGNTFLFRAIYAAAPVATSIGGYDRDSIVTYLALAWIGRSLIFNNIDRDLGSLVSEGDIAQTLTKPYDFQAATYFGAVGELLFRLVLFTIPISFVVFPLFGVAAPASLTSGAAAAVSFLLAFLVSSGLNFVVGTFALRLKSILGLVRAKIVLSEFLTGALVPISFFPDGARRFIEASPFPAIGYVPVTIWMGKREGHGLVEALLVQAAWALALYVLGSVLWHTGVKRTTVQGG
ncbi:MAG: ABC-2 family transporter protein [bacterium]